MFKDKTVWVIGASSGIGEALTLALIKQGARVIISSRKSHALEKVKAKCGEQKENVIIQPIDLSSPVDVEVAADAVLSKIDRLDYIFLNGGISQRSVTEETDIAIDRKLMEVNYFGNIALTKKILPLFIHQGYGHFVVTSSLTGVFGIPLRSAYCASKHALHGYFDTLRAEHTNNNIAVTIVCPGFINTSISAHALGVDGKPTGIFDDAQKAGMSVEKCAQLMLRAVTKKKKEVYIGGKEKMMVYLKRYIPYYYYKLAPNVKPI